jgi:hypothetical protein
MAPDDRIGIQCRVNLGEDTSNPAFALSCMASDRDESPLVTSFYVDVVGVGVEDLISTSVQSINANLYLASSEMKEA